MSKSICYDNDKVLVDNIVSLYVSYAINGGIQQCSCTTEEALLQPCIVSSCSSDVHDVAIRILDEDYSSNVCRCGG